MAKIKTKAFYSSADKDDCGFRVPNAKRFYEVRISGKIDNDGYDYTEEEEEEMARLCHMLNDNGFYGTVFESGAVWCVLNPNCGIANEKEDFKCVYNEWKSGL